MIALWVLACLGWVCFGVHAVVAARERRFLTKLAFFRQADQPTVPLVAVRAADAPTDEVVKALLEPEPKAGLSPGQILED